MFINAIGSVSPQETFDNDQFLTNLVEHQTWHKPAVQPDYKTLLNPRKLRRMSKVIRMGMYAAKVCLAESKVEMPDAILVGTGLGCLEDTEKFLDSIYTNEEGLVTPTQFIQSTHNTVSSAIALMLKCYNYNFTYVHRGFSFESALVDAFMTAEELGEANILVGGIDETTEMYLDITRKIKMWTTHATVDASFHKERFEGNKPGEGAAFFMLGTQKTAQSYAELSGVKMIYKPNQDQVVQELDSFLSQNNLTLDEIDLVLMGLNGHAKKDKVYQQLLNTQFKHKHLAYFKHLCGEFKTASSFALYLASQMLKEQSIPEILKYQPFEQKKLRNVLIVNDYEGINCSMFLVKGI